MKAKHPEKTPPTLSVWKKVVFSLMMVGFVFLTLELALRLLIKPDSPFQADPHISFSGSAPLFIKDRNSVTGAEIMKTAPNKLALFQDQQFPRKKTSGAYRIFCMGGSTTYGRPYNDQTSFAGWLRETLPVADPSKDWEVINAGGVSYASYRVASLMKELTEYEPDLFIVYTGQNEFLEKRVYDDQEPSVESAQRINQLLSHSRIYQVMKNGLDQATGKTVQRSREESLLPEEVETLLENSFGPSSYKRDDSYKEKTIEHFQSNLTRMMAIAKSVGAKIVFVKPASNLKDCSPFKSDARDGLSLQEKHRWETLLAQAETQARDQDWEAALATIDAASEIDDRQASLYYLKGKILYRSGQFEKAGLSFEQALEEDICPLRAVQQLGKSVEAAAIESGSMLVDFVKLVSAESPHQIPGKELFIDHVHPTIEGNRLLSVQILNTLNQNGIVNFGDDWKGDASHAEVKRKVESRLDPQFHGRAIRNLARIYRWAGKFDEAYRLARQALQQLPDDPETLYLIGANALDIGLFEDAVQFLEASMSDTTGSYHSEFALAEALMGTGKAKQAIAHYQSALNLNPDAPECHNNLGNAYLFLEQWEDAILAYKKAVELGYPDGLSNLAQTYHRMGDFDLAITTYKNALATRSDNAQTMSNLASVYLDTGQLAEAKSTFEQALQHDPYLFEAVFNLALVAMQQDRIDEAQIRFQEAIIIRPNSYDAYINLGKLFLNSGKIQDAANTLAQAIRVDPVPAEGYFLGALTLAEGGQLDDARRLSLQAIARRPDWIEAVSLAADLALDRKLFLKSEKQEALTLAEEAVRLSNRGDPTILVTLARAYLVNGQTEQAKTTAILAIAQAEEFGLSAFAEQITVQFSDILKE